MSRPPSLKPFRTRPIVISEGMVERFWRKVDIRAKDQCWPWKGKRNGTERYPVISTGPRANFAQYGSHRVSYALHYGDIPEGLLVCHTCDNRWCVNPHHLFAGTHADNNLDALRKGRQVPGNCRKLSPEDIVKIGKMARYGIQSQDIADLFGISGVTVLKIKGNRYSKEVLARNRRAYKLVKQARTA